MWLSTSMHRNYLQYSAILPPVSLRQSCSDHGNPGKEKWDLHEVNLYANKIFSSKTGHHVYVSLEKLTATTIQYLSITFVLSSLLIVY